jgi:hypothetical protein
MTACVQANLVVRPLPPEFRLAAGNVATWEQVFPAWLYENSVPELLPPTWKKVLRRPWTSGWFT